MMTSTQFVFGLTILLLGTMAQKTHLNLTPPVRQNSSFIFAAMGEKVILQCFHERKDSDRICWYKQTLGQQPKLIASIYKYGDGPIFYHEFQNNSRFSFPKEDQTNHLIISNLRISDSATYFCGMSNAEFVTFGEGTVVSVKSSGSNVKALIHHMAPTSIQPGGSGTLNCTVQTGTCGVEHTFYWFKDSDRFQTGFIYTTESGSEQCERNSNTQTRACVYNLPVNNLTVSDAGTYYCAVASCGYILFGNETMQNFSQSQFSDTFTTSWVRFYNLISRFDINMTITFTQGPYFDLLSHIYFQVNDQDANRIIYASVNVDQSKRSRQRSSSENDCVYSSVNKGE
uniref:Immunoglobulin kappa light chain-like n=1 Tax=Fundulus heteroclitus TaxID=8078 RepID=A0A3Q2TPR2_FUNHE